MFEEIPNRRITERRDSLREAMFGLLGVVGGIQTFLRKGHLDWETLWWAFVFVIGISVYLQKRHEDPWDPPVNDNQKSQGAKG